MTELIIELFKEVNIIQLFAIGVMIWFFYNRLEEKIKEVKIELKELTQKVDEIDKRLCKIEGSLATSGHCLFNQCHNEKKAL